MNATKTSSTASTRAAVESDLLKSPARSSRALQAFVVVGALSVSLTTLAQQKPPPAASVDAVVKAKGYALLKELRGDFDGDGREDVVVALSSKSGVQVGVLTGEPSKLALTTVFPPSGGNELKSLEFTHLMPPQEAPEAVLEVYGENPDEKLKRIRVYTGVTKPREVFSSVIFRAKDKSAREDWERLPGIVVYGDARPGWYFDDVEGDGTMEIIVRKDPQLLKLPRDDDEPANLLTGVRESVYELMGGADSSVYVERPAKRFTDFLPMLPVEKVTGSGAWMPKQERADLESEALSAALYAAAESTDDKAVPDNVEIDLSPYFARVADKNFDTAWIEDDAKGHGKGEWFMLHLAEGSAVRMVRFVPGCIADKKSFKDHNVPTRVELRFDDGEMLTVDLTKPKKPERPAVAMLELPLKNREVGTQTLVFFPKEIATKTVKVTILDVKKQGKANNTCFSEVSVH